MSRRYQRYQFEEIAPTVGSLKSGQLWSMQYLPQKEPLGFFAPIPTFTYPKGIAHLGNKFS